MTAPTPTTTLPENVDRPMPRPPHQPAAAGRNRTATAVSAAIRIAVLTVAGLGWELLARRADDPFFPPPTAIGGWIRRHWLTGDRAQLYLSDELLHHAGGSLARMLTGWSAAALIGISLGLLLGRSRLARDLTNPLVQFGRSLPPVVLVPVFFVLLPPGPPMQIVLIVTGAVWPVLLNTIGGARATDPDLLDAVRVLKISRARRVARVLMPAAAPAIWTGLRISYAIALILMVVSELYAATDGIGHALIAAQQSFDLPAMWAWIVLLAAIGNAGNAALGAAHRRILTRHGHLNPDLTER